MYTCSKQAAKHTSLCQPARTTYPAAHFEMMHVPFEQVTLATLGSESGEGHVAPQAPQLATSSLSFASQPSLTTLLQSSYLRACTMAQEQRPGVMARHWNKATIPSPVATKRGQAIV
jgi:hypothetical protein